MRAAVTLALVLWATAAASAHAATYVRSEMSGWAWQQSTVLAGFLRPTVDRSEDLAVYSAAPVRATYARLWRAVGPSRGLYLILPGTGGDATSPMGGELAEQISRAGFDALVLPSPFSETFQRVFSSDGAIGIPQRDLADVGQMLDSAIEQFEFYHDRAREVNLLGFSLGGTYTALIAGSAWAPRFQRFIALNPPLEFGHAITVIDRMITLALAAPHNPLFEAMGELLSVLARTKYGIDMGNMMSIQGSIGNDEVLNEQIIGATFQNSLKEIIQHGRKLQILPALDGPAGRITFSDYMTYLGQAVVPRVHSLRGKSVHELTTDLGFVNVHRRFPSSARLYVITSADDALSTRESLRAADQALGPRLIVFDKGGHGGYFWTPSFRQVLKGIL